MLFALRSLVFQLSVVLCLIAVPAAAFSAEKTDGGQAPSASDSQPSAVQPAPSAPAPAAAPAPAKAETTKKALAACPAEGQERKKAEGEAMLSGAWKVFLSERVAFGMLGKDFAAEYGVMIEAMSKHFGVTARWAYFQPYPDHLDFTWEFAFAFHYYPFGDGPSGLYVGPGLMILHVTMEEPKLAKNMDTYQLAQYTRLRHKNQFDYMTPMLEIGYRYEFPFYLTLGAEAMVGYAVQDQKTYAHLWGDRFVWLINPQIGVTW